MELRDVIVTPPFIILIYVVAYVLRPMMTDDVTRRYFLPSLTVKIVGALAVGFIYQFYYHGGDTYNFHTHGSRHIWEAFIDSPDKGLKLLFSDGTDVTGIYEYSSKIPFFRDRSSYTIIRLAAFFDLFTFSAYSATAVCFAFLSFIGSWLFFLTFYREKPHLHLWIAVAALFIPSVFFWGSGLFKDTVTMACVCIATYLIRDMVIRRRINLLLVLLLMLAFYTIYAIKIYILLCYMPAIFLWVYAKGLAAIRSMVVKIMMLPFVLAVSGVSAYFAIVQVGKDDPRYNLEKIGNTAMITAYDIAYQTGRDAGSTYSLGELDGSFGSLVRLAPQAVNVSLFRPYVWEVRNPLMLMSALESAALLMLTFYVLYKCWRRLGQALINPDVLFCLVFSLTFAFAVGVSTFNFGTLSRYKIPLLPFYVLGLVLIYDRSNSERNVDALDETE